MNNYFALFGVNDLDTVPIELQKKTLNILSHSEERTAQLKDLWGNWEYPFTTQPYNTPYLDFEVQKHIKNKKSIWPNNAPFAICLTHDIDHVSSSAHPNIAINNLSKKLMFSTSINAKNQIRLQLLKQYLKKIITNVKSNELWCYEKWLELEASLGYKSTFFVFARPSSTKELSIYDCDYTPNNEIVFDGIKMKVKDFWKELHQRGFEVGLHGSYNSYNNELILKKQKEIIEESIGAEVISTRQHFLHYDIHKTPETHKRTGIKVDSSLGFNRAIGFRAGTSFPYEILDENGNGSGVWEIPQIIMDGALFTPNALELNVDLAVTHSLKIMDHVEQVGGCLTLNFHPEYINNEKYWTTYKLILQEAKRRGAYNDTVGGIYNYIQNNFKK